jgi:hypothetical protein
MRYYLLAEVDNWQCRWRSVRFGALAVNHESRGELGMTTTKTNDVEEAKADVFADGSVNLNDLKKEFGIGRTVAYELMNSGRLPYTQFNKRRLVPRSAVKRLLAEGLVGAK